MPFRQTNGPATFINFIHDLASVWKDLASQNSIPIDDDTNTRIIVDDIVNWANTPERGIAYLQCIVHLSLTLDKSHFFSRCFEFVGIDVCDDDNRPAKSKHQLIETWPALEFVRDVAKFIGFCQFYSQFIPNFEIHVTQFSSKLSRNKQMPLPHFGLKKHKPPGKT